MDKKDLPRQDGTRPSLARHRRVCTICPIRSAKPSTRPSFSGTVPLTSSRNSSWPAAPPSTGTRTPPDSTTAARAIRASPSVS